MTIPRKCPRDARLLFVNRSLHTHPYLSPPSPPTPPRFSLLTILSSSPGAADSQGHNFQRDSGSDGRHGALHGADGAAHHSPEGDPLRRPDGDRQVRLRHRLPTRKNGQSPQGIQTHDR